MKILVVDDESEIFTIVSKWLSRNHPVLTATDPQEVLEFMEANDFDVVLDLKHHCRVGY
jgi:CheY-like chemotaxis protein